jgi:pimeloyl-ACP methyl ester carboxylesterase
MNSDVTHHTVTSRDGTSIGYLRQGNGPGVILIQGAMADVYAYRELAAALASSCTVFSAERRGRGLSPREYAPDHDIARDVEDVEAVIAATGATAVFGLSSGAMIALESARTLPQVERVAVYEPPFYDEGISLDGIRRLNTEIDRGQLGAALLDALQTAGTAPAVLQRVPRPIARALARVVLALEGLRPGPASSLRQLLPGIRYDFRDVQQMNDRMETLTDITLPVLLLSGTASPRFLQESVRTVLELIPDGRHVEFDGLGHDGPWNDGDPGQVARALDAFFRSERSGS